MVEQFDVIIIGAGPSGLECARFLKESNLSVLVIEKQNRIGPKACAGGIVETVEPLDLPNSKARNFQSLNIYVGKKHFSVFTGTTVRIVDRKDLGEHQEKLLCDAPNVTLKTGMAVKGIEAGRVITKAGDFGYRYLVGADGSTSIVRKFLKLGFRYMVGIYYDIKDPKDCLNIYLNGSTLRT